MQQQTIASSDGLPDEFIHEPQTISKVLIFIDEWKSANTKEAGARIAYFGRMFTPYELKNCYRKLSNVWADTWHASGSGNFGLTHTDRPFWRKTAKEVVSSLSLPAIYNVSPESKYRTEEAKKLWKSQAYPVMTTIKGIQFGNRSEIPLKRLLKGSPAGIAFYDFCVQASITCIEYLETKKLRAGNLKIHLISDHTDFYLGSGQRFLGLGSQAVLLKTPQTEITLRFSNRNAPAFDYAHLPLGLVDSECYVLGAFHLAAERYATQLDKQIEELSESEVDEVLAGLKNLPLIDYAKFLVTHLTSERILHSRWGYFKNPKKYTVRMELEKSSSSIIA